MTTPTFYAPLDPMPDGLFQVMWSRYGDVPRFIARFKATMLTHGITQAAVADESGFHFAHVSRWLGRSEKTRPDWRTMVLLDEALSRILLKKGAA